MKSVQNIVLFLSVLLYIGLVYISFFNVYQTDDYIFTYSTKRLGLSGNIRDFYMNWGGRYFGYTINMFNPLSHDPENTVPKIYPVVLLSSFIVVVALNFKQYFRYPLAESFRKSLLLFFFYTVMLVSLPEHYYWFTGSNVYFLSAILGGLLLLFYRKFQDSGKKGWLALCIVLTIIIMGSNEILALILLGILGVLYSRNRSKATGILLLAGSIGLLISFMAPGNFRRMGDSADVFYIKWLKRIAFFGLNNIYIALKVILIVPLFIAVFGKELDMIRKRIDFKNAVIIWSISLLPLLLLGYIINSIGRQFESILFFYLVTLSVVVTYRFRNIRKFWWAGIIIIFLPETNILPKKYANFNIDYNVNNIIKDVVFTDLKAYDREIENRIYTIQHAKEDSLVLDKIKTVPKALYFDELSSVHEEKKYVNDQLQKYFNKRYIGIK